MRTDEFSSALRKRLGATLLKETFFNPGVSTPKVFWITLGKISEVVDQLAGIAFVEYLAAADLDGVLSLSYFMRAEEDFILRGTAQLKNGVLARVPSLTARFPHLALQEQELSELYGIEFENLVLNGVFVKLLADEQKGYPARKNFVFPLRRNR